MKSKDENIQKTILSRIRFRRSAALRFTCNTLAACSLLLPTIKISQAAAAPGETDEGRPAAESQLFDEYPATKRTDAGILIVGGLQNKQEHFLGYIEKLETQFARVQFEAIGQSMMNPDHMKDYEHVEGAVAEMVEDGYQKIVAIGFSAGGKHVAKLALEHPEVALIVLLDPVDGGPQPNGKTPIFLKTGDMIRKPTVLMASEFGHIPKLLGQACAPENLAHKHFRAHIDSAHLLSDEIVPGTGHINFLTKPWSYLFALACDNGTADYSSTEQYILSKIANSLNTPF